MLLEDLLAIAEQDSNIDKDKLDVESLKISTLYFKYYQILLNELKVYKKLESEYSKILKLKTEYYMGKAPDSVYKEFPLYHKPLKTELDLYLKSDKDLIALDLKKHEQKIIIDFLENFIKQISARTFSISNAINFIKFKAGVN